MKKTLSMLLAFSMLLGLLTTMGFAAGETTKPKMTISVGNADTHTYDVYQIFIGDLYDGILSNLVWGKNGTGETGKPVAEEVLNALTAVNTLDDKAQLEVIKKYVNIVEADKIGSVSKENSIEVETGYYLMVDKGALADNESYSLYVVQVVGETTIEPKRGTVEFQKKVDDKNDSNTTEDAVVWQDSADYDIGDDVPFQLTGKVADNYDAYTKYQFVFHDKESAGLTFNENSVVVKVDETTITEGYTVVTEGLTDGCTFEVVFENLKTIDAVEANSTITVEYTATLNEKAVIGAAGNPNEARLEFSNNPNWTASGENDETPTGETPWDKVIVFTYKTVINKVDEKNEALTGAEFKLEKKLANDTWETITVVKNDAGTEFTFKGLDDGQYRLTETVTPAGYNTIEPIYFEIAAEHDAEAAEPTLKSLTATQKNGEAFADFEEGKATFTFAADPGNGTLSGIVVNNKGSVLPETGGIGTTIFYVLGGLMAVGAGVLLVAKKRMDA